MKYSVNNPAISTASWLAWHEYVLSGEAKTIIYEQKEHAYYLLSGNAVSIWRKLSKESRNEKDALEYIYLTMGDDVEKYDDLPQSLNESIKAEGYIYDAHWDITNKCNERCVHCYNVCAHNGLRNVNVNELSFEESQKLVDDLCYLGVFRIVLSGGEVLTKSFFIPLCHYIRSRHMQLIIYTNGLAFTEQLLQDLAEVYPSVVCFSVYGHNSQVHDGITHVAGSYKKVLYALDFLKQHSIETCCKNTLLKENYAWWQQTLRKGRQIADKSLINSTIYPSLDGIGLSSHRIEEEQLTEFARNPESPIYYKREYKGACNIFKPLDETPCYNKTNNVYINPQGEICLCIAFQCVIASLREGNIRDLKRTEKKDVFVNDFAQLHGFERLDNWRSMKISDLEECGRYVYCKFCIDVCPGDAYLLTNSLLRAPENHCVIAKARYNASLLDKTP